MSRKIKFRAWYKKEQVMGIVKVINLDEDGRLANSDEIELMQFTGLRDKDRYGIYEGDILKSKNDELFTIDFQYGSYWATSINNNDISYSSGSCSFSEKEFEIVGDIYQHKHLLD